MSPTAPSISMADTVLTLGPATSVAGAAVLVGTCSWTDKTLTEQADWYPKRSMTAAERLGFYASQFPLVEVDSTYYFPPRREMSEGWVERTPAGFTMNVKAWSLLTGHPTDPKSVWPDVRESVLPEHRGKKRLYASHLPADALDEAWARFAHALQPLHDAGKLGAVLFQYPEWWGPKRSHREALAEVRERLPEFRVCVEFRNGAWVKDDEAARTFSFLEDHELAYVVVDEPQGFKNSVPPVVTATTSELAVVRFHGHNRKNWRRKGITAAERFDYHYSKKQLREWVPRINDLAERAGTVHALMNNCYQDKAVNNAADLIKVLQQAERTAV